MRKLAVFTGLIVLASFACAPGLEARHDQGRVQHPPYGRHSKVGEASKYAAEIRLAEINGAGGLKVGDKTYKLSCLRGQRIEAESAPRPPSAHHPGPGACHNRPASRASRPSRREVSNMANKTPMISPGSTIQTTENRPTYPRLLPRLLSRDGHREVCNRGVQAKKRPYSTTSRATTQGSGRVLQGKPSKRSTEPARL